MQPYRSILVHVDGSPRSALRLALARRLAAAQGAEIDALFAVQPSAAELPMAYSAGAEAAALIVQIDAERRRRASETFANEARRPGPAMRWIEVDRLPTQQGFVERAYSADLLVLGQHDDEDSLAWGVPADFVPSVLADSGKPALVLPYAGRFDEIGGTVLLAWKPSREAARAATAALPLLRGARRVHVFGAGAEAEPQEAFAPLATWLARHGVEARPTIHRAPDAEVGETLLSLAADLGADLLVMGSYGHSRMREWLLGGVTRTVLQSMTLPVLMAH